jgi:hypothetical protein
MTDRSIQQVSDSEDKEYDVERQNQSPATENTTLPDLQLITSRVTNHDMHHVDQYREEGDEVYEKISHRRKLVITAVLSFCGFLAPISSTAMLSAVPEVAATFNTNGSIINLSNALYLVFMGLSPVFWGPMGQVYGRRNVRNQPVLFNELHLSMSQFSRAFVLA